MTRLEQMTTDIASLSRYFENDRVFGIRVNKDGTIEVDMYNEGFFKKFNVWTKQDTEFAEGFYFLSRQIGKVIYTTFIDKKKYDEMWESEENF